MGAAAVTQAESIAAERRTLRRELRNRRRALTGAERSAAEAGIVRAIGALGAYRRARAVATYAAFDGEPSLAALAHAARGTGRRFYVPVLRGGGMQFARLDAGGPVRRNFFGIDEPVTRELIDPRRLDLVLTPLVACDAAGTRIGVGRGYYDRCFEFLARRSVWRHPKLVGVGFSFQQVEHLERMPWDVPLWGLATERGTRIFG